MRQTPRRGGRPPPARGQRTDRKCRNRALLAVSSATAQPKGYVSHDGMPLHLWSLRTLPTLPKEETAPQISPPVPPPGSPSRRSGSPREARSEGPKVQLPLVTHLWQGEGVFQGRMRDRTSAAIRCQVRDI